MEGCICLSSELVDPDFPVLCEEMAASASGRLSSSSWLLTKIKDILSHFAVALHGFPRQSDERICTHKLNCRTSRFLRAVLVLGCGLSGVRLSR